MNYYHFIDSADVRDHLERKQYRFSPLEAAFVVWQSRSASMENLAQRLKTDDEAFPF